VTVRRTEDGRVVLEGTCPVEDAEPLLELLQQSPAAVIDWTGCTRLHTAVVQVVLAAGAEAVGPCGDAWVRDWIEQARLQKPAP
jgi:hypothetical protein